MKPEENKKELESGDLLKKLYNIPKEGEYAIKCYCENCQNNQVEFFPKGTTVNLHGRRCNNCGCLYTLKRTYKI